MSLKYYNKDDSECKKRYSFDSGSERFLVRRISIIPTLLFGKLQSQVRELVVGSVIEIVGRSTSDPSRLRCLN